MSVFGTRCAICQLAELREKYFIHGVLLYRSSRVLLKMNCNTLKIQDPRYIGSRLGVDACRTELYNPNQEMT
jgi:hypothetical protein